MPDGVGFNAAEHGRSGTEISAGTIQRPYIPSTILGDDYLTDWKIDTVDKMLRGDGQVAGIKNAIKLSILQSDWEMIPYKEPGADRPARDDIEIAKFAEEQIKRVWSSVRGTMADHIWYGFMLFEPIFGEENGKIVWRRLAARLPWTVNAWESVDGHVGRVNQYTWDNQKQMFRSDIWIPGEKVLRFTNDQVGENYEGQSVLRGAYKHWLMKDALYKIAAIRHERYGVGTPIGALPADATDEEEEKFRDVLKALRSNEYGYIYAGKIAGEIPLKDVIDIMVPAGGQAGSNDLMELIHHHDIMIARSVLAQFINLGESDGGTRALSEDMTDLFLMNLASITQYMGHVISEGNDGESHGLRDLVDLNFSGVKGYPQWTCVRTKKTDSHKEAAVIAQLVQSGAMEPDDTLEGFLRRIFGIPVNKQNPRPVKTVTRERTEQQVPKTHEAHECDHGTKKLQERERMPYEQFVAFEEIADNLDRAENEIVVQWRSCYKRQLNDLGSRLGPYVTRDDLSKLRDIELIGAGEMAETFHDAFEKCYQYGRTTVRGELLRQAGVPLQEFDPLDEDETDELLVIQAANAAKRLTDKARSTIESILLASLVVSASMPWSQVLEKAWLVSDGDARLESYFVDSAFGMGRNSAEGTYRSLIQDAYYSSVLDIDTCAECASKDGLMESQQPFIVPNPACYGAVYSKTGANPCRCIKVLILKSEVSSADINAMV